MYCLSRGSTMQGRKDELSFEGAWENQFKQEQKEPVQKKEKEVKVHSKPEFRGQRDVVEKRAQIRMQSKQKTVVTAKKVEVSTELSSKQGDDFDVEW